MNFVRAQDEIEAYHYMVRKGVDADEAWSILSDVVTYDDLEFVLENL